MNKVSKEAIVSLAVSGLGDCAVGVRRIWRDFRAFRKTLKTDLRSVASVMVDSAGGQHAVEMEGLRSFLLLAERIASDGHAPEVGQVIGSFSASTAQFRQDLFCLLFANAKRGGFFVEFGACDGVEISNTLLLERQFGWTGILAEPGRHWHESLRRNRVCSVDTRCVWNRSGDKVSFNQTTFDDRSAVAQFYAAAAGELVATYEVETISLADLLTEYSAPRSIDFLSIDVEGAEAVILDSFPFNSYRFGFICIEQHGEALGQRVASILNPVGYRQVLGAISGYDGWYLPLAEADRLGLA